MDDTNGASPSGRVLGERDLAYDRISHSWESFISNYDTSRRVEVLIGDFLGEVALEKKNCLDAGCGLGYFTNALVQRGATVTSIDIAPNLVSRLQEKLPTIQASVGDLMGLPAAMDGKFDVVVSSEVIEHTPDPRRAVGEIAKCVAPGGVVVISCPNRRWHWLLTLAQKLGLRDKYAGYENWVSPADLVEWLQSNGLKIVRTEGVHTVPWQFLPKPVLRLVDKGLRRSNYPFALNLAVMAERRSH